MDPALDRAYRDTEYRIHLDDGILCLHIGCFDQTTDIRLAQMTGAVSQWAIVTPVNPRSTMLCDQENSARLENFHRMLSESGFRWIHSSNHDPDNLWPDEPGALIMNIPRIQAFRLGLRLGQNAIVYGQRGKAPELVWLDTKYPRQGQVGS